MIFYLRVSDDYSVEYWLPAAVWYCRDLAPAPEVGFSSSRCVLDRMDDVERQYSGSGERWGWWVRDSGFASRCRRRRSLISPRSPGFSPRSTAPVWTMRISPTWSLSVSLSVMGRSWLGSAHGCAGAICLSLPGRT